MLAIFDLHVVDGNAKLHGARIKGYPKVALQFLRAWVWSDIACVRIVVSLPSSQRGLGILITLASTGIKNV